MKLALFDLDHTLIPFDSGMAWTQYLVARGALPAEAEAIYLGHCQQYVAGRLDIFAMHRATVSPLARFGHAQLAEWAVGFELVVRRRSTEGMLALVRQHREAGDLCALVTATARFIAEPCARAFGLANVVATDPATADGTPQGTLTGEIDGLPCFREHKVTRVQQWLAAQRPGGAAALADFAESSFYSDSVSDLPLLQAVSRPVAVRPDDRLRAHAEQAGWPVWDRT